MYFIDADDYTWLINIDEIICVEQHSNSECKSIIHMPNFNIWMAEPVSEIYDMIKKHFEENEKVNSK